MSENVLIALIAAVGSIIGSVIAMHSNKKTIIAEFEKNSAIQAEKIDQLDKKVEKHNKVIERVYKLEQHEAVIDSEIEHLKDYHKQ